MFLSRAATDPRFARRRRAWVVLPILALLVLPAFGANEFDIRFSRNEASDFPLVEEASATPIIVDAADAQVARIAANLLAQDVQAVTGLRPTVTHAPAPGKHAVIIGTVGQSPLLEQLSQRGAFNASELRGRWECFKVEVLKDPFPGIDRALLIAGSDRRGTAYGVVSLSEAIGVSPWHWWADVPAVTNSEIFVGPRAFLSSGPSIRYRGIFINDEDWGMHPWAGKTLGDGHGEKPGIGPKTYEKVFELLLRLKANTLWPAMHACSVPFNANPTNRELADAYAIVMGSSHAEPMLRNNVGEWTLPHAEYNYQTHSNTVRSYWEERLKENGRYENIYTLGMRGIHDSRMQGPRGRVEQIRMLEQIFADQRDLIAKHVSTNLDSVPQVFCAYKEVLDLYRGGLQIPDDVTIMFPDDNFGYMRMLPGPEDRRRRGGFGAYYHISYLGRPLSYLWLCTTPPALIWEEMSKAYDHGVREMWIVNVGDIKPAEIGTEFFLALAWDVRSFSPSNVNDFLRRWAAREFGDGSAQEIADILDRYYRLNHQRKPEHLQWWLPDEEPRPSPLSEAEIQKRLQEFATLVADMERVEKNIPPGHRDAFFQLIHYPVAGSALANRRYFLGELGSPGAAAAHAQLADLTRRYNEEIADGKWRHFMQLEPADDQWRGMRIRPWEPRKLRQNGATNEAAPAPIVIEAEAFKSRRDSPSAHWEVVRGLGPSGDSVAIFPTTAPSADPLTATAGTASLHYPLNLKPDQAGELEATIWLVPTFPLRVGTLRIALGIGDSPPQLIEVPRRDGSPEWAQGVLNAAVPARGKLRIPADGNRELRLYMVDPGVVVDRIDLKP